MGAAGPAFLRIVAVPFMAATEEHGCRFVFDDGTGTMDVASTILLQHLRKGHGRVLEALFES